nr:hypothetical protein [Tanacetum cinerariifolium]
MMVVVSAGIMTAEAAVGVRMVVMIRGDDGSGGEGDVMMMVVRWASVGARRWVAEILAGSDPEEELVVEEPLEEPKEKWKLEESEEANLDLFYHVRSRPGPAKSGDSCKSKVKPKRGPS